MSQCNSDHFISWEHLKKRKQKKNIFNNFLKIINLHSSNLMPLSHYLIALN